MRKTIKGQSVPKSKLDAYSVGLLRLSEAHISNVNFERDDIEYIGQGSINRKKVVIGKIGNFWCIEGRAFEAELKVKAHGKKDANFRAYYIVQGKRVTTLHPATCKSMSEYESKERLKPLCKMDAGEIFRAGRGVRSQKRGGRANGLGDIGQYKNRPCVSLSVYGY